MQNKSAKEYNFYQHYLGILDAAFIVAYTTCFSDLSCFLQKTVLL
jgi:hypothetical protein